MPRGNPNPSPATRFKKGHKAGTREAKRRATILRKPVLERVAIVRTLDEVRAANHAWHGTMREFFESVARDPIHELPIRLHCAALLLREGQDDGRKRTLPPIDPASLPDNLRRAFEDILLYAEMQRCEQEVPADMPHVPRDPVPMLTIDSTATEDTTDAQAAGPADDSDNTAGK